jgi:hypothetical protein
MARKMPRKSAGDRAAAEKKEEFSLIPHATLRALYTNLLKCRRLKRRGAWRFDAALVAAATDLRANDTVVSDDDPVLRKLLGARRCFGEADAAARLHEALGAAMEDKTRNVAVVFAKDAEDEHWVAALESALRQSLPVVFVHETDLDRERPLGMAAMLAAVEPGTEMPVITVDGDDVVAAYRVAHEAIDRARRDRGPTLIECVAFKGKGLRGGDAVVKMKRYLRSKGLGVD